MSEIVKINPEGLELANTYLQNTSIDATAAALCISREQVIEGLAAPEVRKYINDVYLDQGYRNRWAFWGLFDKIIEQKLEEAEENEFYSSKDLVEILEKMHKMKMEEIKQMQKADNAEGPNIGNQTNVQINSSENFGGGNYGDLMKRLLDNE